MRQNMCSDVQKISQHAQPSMNIRCKLLIVAHAVLHTTLMHTIVDDNSL